MITTSNTVPGVAASGFTSVRARILPMLWPSATVLADHLAVQEHRLATMTVTLAFLPAPS